MNFTIKQWWGGYVTINEETFLLDVDMAPSTLKKQFAEWYKTVPGYLGGVTFEIKKVVVKELTE